MKFPGQKGRINLYKVLTFSVSHLHEKNLKYDIKTVHAKIKEYLDMLYILLDYFALNVNYKI